MGDSRYNVLGQPLAAPGRCFVSGETGADHGPYIDTGVNIGFQSPKGALYLSKNVIEESYREIQKYLGIEDPQIVADKAEYDRGFQDGILAMQTKFKETYGEFIASLVDTSDDGADSGDSSVSPNEDAREDSGESEGSSPSADVSAAKSAPTSKRAKSGSVSGSDVHAESEPDLLFPE